ncbi:MAG: 16S rRNA (cytidine(1402)-2'-O)-methyltransferase [Parcubacteria group bacterium]|nr:16S rRNA (cytidine(1402)-2'-O)-methyltransferase [Parcubacteria group bacterium]
MGKLFVLATPIGNLKDITLRGLEILKEADFILAEDTRVAKKLLNHYQISKPVISFFEHSPDHKISQLIKLLKEGKNLVLVSDAGTPNLSDPGHALIKSVIENLGSNTAVIPVPGSSSLTALISITHFSLSEFIFLGFPPSKKGRNKFFDKIGMETRPIILFESTHRILKTLESLAKVSPLREMVLAKELTKVHEQIWRGSAVEINQIVSKISKDEIRGEFVLALNYGE